MYTFNSFTATGDYGRPCASTTGDYSRPPLPSLPLATSVGFYLLRKNLNFTDMKVWHPQVEIWQRKS